MKLFLPLFCAAITIISVNAQNENPKEIRWELNRLDSIGGWPVSLIGNPKLIEIAGGFAVEFDGQQDGLLIESNPLVGATEFTIEVVFMPYSGGPAEQRFVHMEQDDNNRVLIELRSTPDENWFLDTFVKSESSSRALYAEDYLHSNAQWWHAALVFKDNVMTHYVDGVEEMSDEVSFLEVESGSTSLGVRQNLVSWYKGAIKTLKITHKALSPEEFLMHDSIANLPVLNLMNRGNEQSCAVLFPNPVKDVASLAYSIDQASHVIIDTYSMQLQPIARLVDTYQTPGSYAAEFRRGLLPSGLYFYTLRIGDDVSIEKFLILDE